MGINKILKKGFNKVGLDIQLVRNIQAAQKKSWEKKWAEQWRFLRNNDIKPLSTLEPTQGCLPP